MSSNAKKKILLIDDDRLVLNALKRLLEMENYFVEAVDNAEKVLQLISYMSWDLIISDIRMPDMDGVDLIKKLRQIYQNQGKETPPVIFITGYIDSEKNNEAIELGPIQLIYKPFEKEQFLSSIRDILGV